MSPLVLQGVWLVIALMMATVHVMLVLQVIRALRDGWSFSTFIALLPSVNFRVFVGVVLGVCATLVVLGGTVINAGGVFRATFDKDMVEYTYKFILSMMGLDVIAFGLKRFSYKTDAPDATRDAPPPAGPQAEPAKAPEPVPPVPLKATVRKGARPVADA